MKKGYNLAIKQKTTTEIYDGIAALSVDDNPELLTITNIAKRSGYSIGNIYHHFKNIDDIIDSFAIDRIKKKTDEFIEFINNAPSTQTATEFLKLLIDINFNLMRNKMPKVMLITLANKVYNRPHVIKKIHEINLSAIDPFEAMIKRNETNTFKNLTHQEMQLAMLLFSNSMRLPFVLNHKLTLTKSHQDLTLAIGLALFAK